MSSKFSLSLYTLALFSILLITKSLADVTPSDELLSVDSVCGATPDPAYCKSILPNAGKYSIHDHSRSSISQSLKSAMKFSTVIEKFLEDRSSLSNSVIRALQDCQLLMGLNLDFLETCGSTISSTQSLPEKKTSELHAMLGALVTNQQTCLDGIVAASSPSNVKDGLSALSDGTKLYSVSLGLFTRGWGNRKFTSGNKKVKGHWGNWKKILPNKHHRKVIESISRRKLLQASDTVVIRDIVVVNPDGSGDFTIINAAIAAAPNKTNIADGYFMIYVVSGVYQEYVNIDKNKRNILLIGDGINQTVITGNRSVGDGWTTFNSATLVVVGQGFLAIGITVRNTAGAAKNQAVAVRNGADMSTFYSCSFEGYQDTLYPHSLRQFYRECDIYGTVDFIFGNGAVVFQNCNIYPRLPLHGQFDPITAQGRTDPNQNTGISIQNCVIKAAADLAADNGTTQTYLGRPWKEYSRTVYMQSFMDSLINPAGWHEWSGDFALSTLYYAEYANTGPGSNTANRVAWPGYHVITATDAISFTVSNFISGNDWLPATGVPYDAGL